MSNQLAEALMNEQQLPPLPEPEAYRHREEKGPAWSYTADQMRDYARAALAANVPADHVTVPLSLLEGASSAIGHFVSDHGWGDEDMQAMDNLDAYIARHKAIAAAPAPEAEMGAVPACQFYKTGDQDAPKSILDRNGEVVLSMCKVCGKAEGEIGASKHLRSAKTLPQWHCQPGNQPGVCNEDRS